MMVVQNTAKRYTAKGEHMPLTATFAKNIKHTDGGGIYLLVNAGGKYWRMNYRFADKRKTLALRSCLGERLQLQRKRGSGQYLVAS